MLNVTHQLKKKLFLTDLDERESPTSTRKVLNNQDVSSSSASTSEPQSKGHKSLPSLPSPEEEESMNLSIARKRSPSNSTPLPAKAYGPYFLEYTLMAEYNQLRSKRLPGVYVLPAAKSPLVWYGVIFIRMGSYQDGAFKFTMTVPDNYPDGECPKLVFKPPIFHPVVNIETGELDVKRAFPKWRRSVNHLWQVLLYTRRIFYKIDTRDPLNPEAANLYENDKETFKQKVNECLRTCHNELHIPVDDDPHCIHFVELEPQKIDEVKETILESQSKPGKLPTANAHKSGLSWMKKGSSDIFTIEQS
ncbi:protein AKTIP homolog [Actinia tenebrosa]|uniref:Protein AKTIP homolog n=1 Tax=Actinia tenebrosa TaxID=6105 RepID=A0A6P8I1S9_ACTTE|nr:protein AKTIP homolog [Actinia tenebrosa]